MASVDFLLGWHVKKLFIMSLITRTYISIPKITGKRISTGLVKKGRWMSLSDNFLVSKGRIYEDPLTQTTTWQIQPTLLLTNQWTNYVTSSTHTCNWWIQVNKWYKFEFEMRVLLFFIREERVQKAFSRPTPLRWLNNIIIYRELQQEEPNLVYTSYHCDIYYQRLHYYYAAQHGVRHELTNL